MGLNLHHLRLFAAVVDQGGFTRAGRALRLSQPAISKSITELEREIGLSLLDRSAKTVRLTEAGRALHTRAREIFGIEKAAEQELRELRGMERGILRVGASTTIATYFLPRILGRFHEAHPKIEIRSASANTRQIAKMLLEWRIDVALVEGPVSNQRLAVIPWQSDELVVIAHPGHRLLHARSTPSVHDLVNETFIMRERGSGTREVAERALADRGVKVGRTMRVGGTEVIKQAVAAGLGIAIVARAAAADQLALDRIAVVPVDGLTIHRQLSRLRLRGRPPTSSGRAFEALLDAALDDVGIPDASGDPG